MALSRRCPSKPLRTMMSCFNSRHVFACVCIFVSLTVAYGKSTRGTSAKLVPANHAEIRAIPSTKRAFLNRQLYQKIDSNDILENVANRHQNKDELVSLLVDRLRGGAESSSSTLELSEDDSNNDGVFITKTRNVIRSLLEILDRKFPLLGALLRSLVQLMEKITGTRLLPVPKQKKKKKRAAKKKAAAVETDKDEIKTTTKKTKSLSSSRKKKKTTKKTEKAKSNKHLDVKLSHKSPNYRIQRELKEFITNPPPNLKVKVGSNIRIWIVTLTGAKNTIYEDEVYKLRIQFPKEYPSVPPSVYFLQPTPKHEHVYTNGDICLSLLGKGWRPTMTAQSIAVSILSILSSAQTKSLPMDNAAHSQNKPGQFQKDWVYHDDNC